MPSGHGKASASASDSGWLTFKESEPLPHEKRKPEIALRHWEFKKSRLVSTDTPSLTRNFRLVFRPQKKMEKKVSSSDEFLLKPTGENENMFLSNWRVKESTPSSGAPPAAPSTPPSGSRPRRPHAASSTCRSEKRRLSASEVRSGGTSNVAGARAHGTFNYHWPRLINPFLHIHIHLHVHVHLHVHIHLHLHIHIHMHLHMKKDASYSVSLVTS